MKRKIIYSALACGLAVTLGGAALASSADESLISRSYLEGTFLQELTQEIGDWVDAAFSPIYEDAQDELDRIGQGYLSSLDSPAVPIPEGWSGSDQFVAQTGRAGDTVTLKPGSGIYWNSGSASASGVLVDVTDGEEVRAGGPLESGHRYLAAEDPVTITVSSQQAGWSVEGIWSATAEQEPPGPVDEPLPFTDVSEDDWYYDEVKFVVDNGLMVGTSDTSFEPEAQSTRVMVWTILARMDGETIAGANWAQDAREWAVDNKVSDGSGGDNFITREELVTMLWRYEGQPNGTGNLNGFSDAGAISDWAEEAMSWSVGTGLILGDEDGLTPKATATRAQIAAILMRYCENVAQ